MELFLFSSYIILALSAFFSIQSIIRLLRKSKFTGYIIFILVLILFFVLPMFLDLISDVPFDLYPTIYKAWKDPLTTILYSNYMSVVLIYFTANMRNVKHSDVNIISLQNAFLRIFNRYKFVFYIVLILPFISVFLSDNPSFYFKYRSTLGFKFSPIYPNTHALSSKLCLLSIICIAFLITVMRLNVENKIKKYNILNWIIVILLVVSYCWIDGKRAIVAVFLSIIFILFMSVKLINRKNLGRSCFFLVAIFLAFNVVYGKNINTSESAKTQKKARLEFSRDYGVRFNIYNEILQDHYFLPHKLDTYKFNMAFYVPRKYWKDKPQPYAVYFTNAAFGNFGRGSIYGWGLTTNAFSEGISNLGWIGLIIVPFFLNWILKRETKSNKPLFKLVSILVAILSLVLQPMPFMPIIILYFILLFNDKKNKEIHKIKHKAL